MHRPVPFARGRAKAVIFDRDGTLNRDAGYTWRPEDLVWIAGAPETVRFLNERGWRVIVCTNQSGVARGLFTEDDVARFHRAMQQCLASAGAHIDRFYVCPFHPDGVVERYRREDHDRKPQPGMIERAISEWSLDRTASFVVGDRQRDIEAAHAAGLRGYLFEGGRLDDFVRRLIALPSSECAPDGG